jgi:DNA-binding XRE family transcriptional regulator
MEPQNNEKSIYKDPSTPSIISIPTFTYGGNEYKIINQSIKKVEEDKVELDITYLSPDNSELIQKVVNVTLLELANNIGIKDERISTNEDRKTNPLLPLAIQIKSSNPLLDVSYNDYSMTISIDPKLAA